MKFSHSQYNPRLRLSPEEMLEISQEINRDFAPDFSIETPRPVCQHTFSPKEMLEISEEISRDFAPKTSDNAEELVLLPVDPDHLYVYWNLSDNKLNTTYKNASGNQLTLRIYSEQKKTMGITGTKSWFDVDIKSTQAQQKIFLPSTTGETVYSATIGKRYPDNSLAPFASSNITHVPLGKVMPPDAMESQAVFKSTPKLVTTSRELSACANNSASGQGNN